jgi:limonene-1,2-epoxide hydrolase
VREKNIGTVEAYLNALKKKDLALAPFADEIIFWDTIIGKTVGAENLRGFLSGFLPAIKDVRVISHVCEGEWVCTRWQCEADFGLVEIGEFFRVRDGKIFEAHGYFDPRLVIG